MPAFQLKWLYRAKRTHMDACQPQTVKMNQRLSTFYLNQIILSFSVLCILCVHLFKHDIDESSNNKSKETQPAHGLDPR